MRLRKYYGLLNHVIPKLVVISTPVDMELFRHYLRLT